MKSCLLIKNIIERMPREQNPSAQKVQDLKHIKARAESMFDEINYTVLSQK
jgi:hypothetical protein